VLGLPDTIRACLFDLDGVLTDTASLHRKAWAATFDPVLAKNGQPPFSDQDYEDHVDGKPRLDGVRDLLAARHIAASEDLVNELAERKNADVLRRIKHDGVDVFEGSRRYLEAARKAGLARVVVSSSANTADVLEVTGLAPLVEARVDGVTLAELHIPGKPAPDSFLAGARRAGVPPDAAAVFEDATAGVEAGRRGKFGFVVGVNRHDAEHAAALRSHGASVVVADLAELL
jgi:beta-phosphoglucomutase family hydrolase